LLKEGVPYKLVGGFRFYERKEIKDIISYLRFVYNIKDELSLDRVLNVPTRKIGPKTVAILHESAKQIGCSVGELLVAAYMSNHPEVGKVQGIREDILGKIPSIEENLGKLQSIISTFGYIYVEAQNKNILDIIEMILEKTNYIRWFDDGSDQAEMKKENISELKNVAYTYVQKSPNNSLETFLNEINLIEQEQDKNQDGSGSYVNLMTLHSSKGLEFNYVFMIGMEEGLLPHSRAFVDENELEEERRLCYVGITRARQKLTLTFAEKRLTREGLTSQIPSRFLGEIPQDICEYFSWSA